MAGGDLQRQLHATRAPGQPARGGFQGPHPYKRMDLDRLKQVLELVREHGVSELEIEEEGLKLRVRRDRPRELAAEIAPAGAGHAAAAPVGPAPAPPEAAAREPAGAEPELAIVKSPMVGTFYRAPDPAAPPFVEVGSIVKKGQVLCIIEAMKLMNEIDSEHDGEVVGIYVENGQPVQYAERLFAIRVR
jgi:acetyl-CoA carboxylase biotin carboxyl carrier protein